MKKRLLSLFLSACMLLSLLPGSALALLDGSPLDKRETDQVVYQIPGSGTKTEASFEKAWNAIAEAGRGGTVTLTRNVTASGGSFGSGKGFGTGGSIQLYKGSVTIDLAGYTIDRGLANAAARDNGGVFYVGSGSTLTLKNSKSTGKVTGGNTTGSGGGVSVQGTLVLDGVTISDNKAAVSGGGVYNGNIVSAKGVVTVIGNTAGTAANNVFLPSGRTVSVSSGLGNGARIGVTTAAAPQVGAPVTIAAGQLTETDTARFVSDDTNLLTGLANGNVVLKAASDSGTESDHEPVQAPPVTYTQPQSQPSAGSQAGAAAPTDAEDTFTVTLIPNGGMVSTTTQTYKVSETNYNLPTPTRTGYTFDGWYTTNDENGVKVEQKAEITDRTDHKLYARWNRGRYTVTFDAQDGTPEPSTRIVTYHEPYGELPKAPEFSKEGYEFAGWFAEGNKIEATTLVAIAKDHTLIAHWTPVKVKDENPGDDTKQAQYSDGSTVETGTFEDMWNKAAENGGTVTLLKNVTAVDGSFGSGVGFDGGIILIPDEKTITLNLNGKKLDRGLDTAQTRGYVIQVGTKGPITGEGKTPANFTLQDSADGTGTITGGYNLDSVLAPGVYYSGGGILVLAAKFTMEGGNITGNSVLPPNGTNDPTAGAGGGVSCACADSTFTMSGGKISNNRAYTGAGVANKGTFNMTRGEISNNEIPEEISAIGQTTSDGGGVSTFKEFTLSGGTISNNTAVNRGGGVYVGIGDFTMSGGTISENSTSHKSGLGGGISFASTGAFTMSGGMVTQNSAPNGSGIDLSGNALGGNSSGKAILSGGTITRNNGTPTQPVHTGAGIVISNNFTVEISGDLQIYGNTCTRDGTTTNTNLYLKDGQTVTVTGAMTGSTNICVTTATKPTEDTPVTVAVRGGSYTLTEDDKSRFSSDELFTVEYQNNQIVLTSEKKTCTITLKAGLSGATFGNGTDTFELNDVVVGTALSYVLDNAPKPTTNSKAIFLDWSLIPRDQITDHDWTIGSEVKVTGDTTVYGIWDDLVEITFDANDGEFADGSTQKIRDAAKDTATFDDVISGVEEPKRTGYTFAGWHTDPDTDSLVDKTQKVDSATTLYAHWTKTDPEAEYTPTDASTTQEGTFEAMWNLAAANGGTVKLLKDISAKNIDSKKGIFGSGDGFGDSGYILVPDGKSITLDLNGHTLSRGLKAAQDNGHVIQVGSDATKTAQAFLTIKGSNNAGNTGTLTGGYSTGNGGGILVLNGDCSLRGVSVEKNYAKNGGGAYGAVYLYDHATVRLNTATRHGGGVYWPGTLSPVIDDSSITGNAAVTGQGGGVYYDTPGGRIRLYNTVTIADNTAYLAQGAFFTEESTTFPLSTDSKIYVVTEKAPTPDAPVEIARLSASKEDKSSVFHSSKGYLVEWDDANNKVLLVAPPDDVEARYDPPTPQGSAPATQTGSFQDMWNLAAENNGTVTLLKDITAKEVNGVANSFGTGAGFGPPRTETSGSNSKGGYVLVPDGKTITLDLNGHTLDRAMKEGRDQGYVIRVGKDSSAADSAKFTLKDTQSDGKVTGGWNSGYLRPDGGVIDANGGGIYVNSGTFTMEGGTITGNRTDTADKDGNPVYGGGNGVFINKGTFNLTGGEITGSYGPDSADNEYTGSGVYNNGAIFNMSGGTISGFNSPENGGGVHNYGTFNMSDGTITGNAASNGAGVHSASTGLGDALFKMTGGTISGNVAKQNGGGAYLASSSGMTGGTIRDNVAGQNGGGVYLAHGQFDMEGGVITQNTAPLGGGVYYGGPASDGTPTFRVSGKVTVSGNKGSNVYLTDNVPLINNDNTSTELSDDSVIGVTTILKPTVGKPVEVAKPFLNDADKHSVFRSDEGYQVEWNDEEKLVQFVLPDDKFIVEYDPAGGTLDGAPLQFYANDGSETLKDMPQPTRDGYAFLGWFSNDDYTGDGDIEAKEGDAVNSDMKLYAHWEAITVTYTVSYHANGGTGTMTGHTDVLPNEEIALKANGFTAPSGKEFDCWAVGSADGERKNPGDKITVTEDTEIFAVWKTKSSPSDPSTPSRPGGSSGGSSGGGSSGSSALTITSSAGTGGSISPKGRIEVKRGSDKTYTITAQSGYVISDVLVDGKSVGAVSTYTFEDIRRSHTIKAVFTKSATVQQPTQPVTTPPATSTSSGSCPRDASCPIAPYNDAQTTAWYHDGVHACIANGLMTGTGNGRFEPSTPLSRGMLAQILYNHEGKPAVGGNSTFPDVPSGAWYENAVKRASATGIVAGYENGSYGPNDAVTREQLVVILWRHAGSPVPINSTPFSDFNDTREYARDAVRWAYGGSIISGKEGNRFDPSGKASRAEVAQMLKNYFLL